MAGTLFQTKGMKSYGRYGAVGFELLASIAVGYYIGHWLDGKLGTSWIGFVGFILGCYAGFRGLFRTAKQMQRDIEREERLERGEDPWADDAGASAKTDLEPAEDKLGEVGAHDESSYDESSYEDLKARLAAKAALEDKP